jgi:hypothetical protein
MSDINNVTETSATNSVEIVTESSNTNQIKQVKFSDDIHKKYFISNGSNSNELTSLSKMKTFVTVSCPIFHISAGIRTTSFVPSENEKEIMIGLTNPPLFVKDNSSLSHESLDKCIAELSSYVKALEDETNDGASVIINK